MYNCILQSCHDCSAQVPLTVVINIASYLGNVFRHSMFLNLYWFKTYSVQFMRVLCRYQARVISCTSVCYWGGGGVFL